jgi:hypothetical protein
VVDPTRRDLSGDLIQAPRDEAAAHALVTRTEQDVAAVEAELQQVRKVLDDAMWLADGDPVVAQFLGVDETREAVAAAERRLAEVQRDLATARTLVAAHGDAKRALAEADRALREW